MTKFSRHGEWLSLIDVSGPFLAEPVLNQAFPQGLEQTDPLTRKHVRQAYDEWREAVDIDDPQAPAVHDAWIGLVLKKVLELDEDDEGDVLKPKGELPGSLTASFPEHDVTLRPDFAIVDAQKDDGPLMFVAVYAPDTELSAPVKGDKWAASPAERMVELCRARDVRLGLVTNGERWMLIDAPVGGEKSFASWHARLWGQEPITLQAFINILGIRRFFVDDSERLPALLDESLKLQDEVTDALGEQVQRAVEVLVQALDRADVDRNRELLAGVKPSELYEAALTIMMRIVFLLSAEERGLLLLDDDCYQASYAVSTLRMHLRAESEEILERRQDAWSRLLAVFRTVYGGIEHEALKLPALGGSLFDPDRFPFLEGRAKGTNWKEHSAAPLPIDNRTVLLLLDSVQLFEGRTLSYRALDIEQIGYVYEGLLERTVVRARDVTLDLDATKNTKTPWVTLDELEYAYAEGENAVQSLLQDRTGSSASRVKNDLVKMIDDATVDKLLTACHGDQSLRDSIKPYIHFLRVDRWGYPLVYPVGTFMVMTGKDRRETGTHYTPKSLTEAIVKETMNPLVYVGPAEGRPREEWILRQPDELLDLKICDPAMGSGAFLVQVCRWLSQRVVEAWSEAETVGKAITAEGEVVDYISRLEPMSGEVEDRVLTARRLIAERCLYGVDMNPLAVELAKLSIWLITMAKGRPFGFLDHNLRCGDSLLGIHDLDQLLSLEMTPSQGSSKKIFAAEIDAAVERALEIRAELHSRPIRDIRDVEFMALQDVLARRKLEIPQLIADAFIGEVLAGGVGGELISLSIEAGETIDDPDENAVTLIRRARKGLRTGLPVGRPPHRTFHWPLEFPEVFRRERPGFDAMLGNPPFSFGKNVSATYGTSYNSFLVSKNPYANKNVDLVAHFFSGAQKKTRPGGVFGFIATSSISEGATKDASLDAFLRSGLTIISATSKGPWPGKANVFYCKVIVINGKWTGSAFLNGQPVSFITSSLTIGARDDWTPAKLRENKDMALVGVIPNGSGFILNKEEAHRLLQEGERYHDIIWPYVTGQDINADSNPARFIINFWNWNLSSAENYPSALAIVRGKVFPHRQTLSKTKERVKNNWWLFEANARKLCYELGFSRHFLNTNSGKTADLKRAIVTARISKTNAFDFYSAQTIFAAEVVVFPSDSFALFSVLQSNIHIVFAWQHGGKMKADLRYSPTLCVETFPFPEMVRLESVGQEYYSTRCDALLARKCGLTSLYNLVHDESVNNSAIEHMREAQRKLDCEVANSFGWDDIRLEHDFHEVSYLPISGNRRFTISESARTEILHRLSILNKVRSGEESIIDLKKRPTQGNRTEKSTHTPSQDMLSVGRLRK